MNIHKMTHNWLMQLQTCRWSLTALVEQNVKSIQHIENSREGMDISRILAHLWILEAMHVNSY